MSSVGDAGLPGMPNDVWPLVHVERLALIDDLAGLDDEQWSRPSLCDGWTVHDVVAHLVDVALTTRLGFAVDMAQETLRRLRDVASRPSGPSAPRDTRIVEEVVHGEDIRRAVGLRRDYPGEAVVRSLRQQARMPASFGGAKELVARIRLSATDLDLSIGDGPEVSGPALALLLAITGRRVALAELDGPGLAMVH
jgi:mycothiol maleylpyruvate isomerase-like protein